MANQTKKCPQCAEEIKAEVKVCQFCSAKFEEAKEVKDGHSQPQSERRTKMKKSFCKQLLGSIIILIVVPTFTGCTLFSDQTKADKSFEKAFVQYSNYSKSTSSQKEINELLYSTPLTLTGLIAAGTTPVEAKQQLLERTKSIKEMLNLRKKAMSAAKKEFVGVKTMRVNSEYKKYAEMNIDVCNAYIELIDIELQLASECENVINQLVPGTELIPLSEVVEAHNKKRETFMEETNAITKKITELNNKSDDYGKKHNIIE